MFRRSKFREFQLLRNAWPLVVAEAAYSIIYLTDASMISVLGKEQPFALAAFGTPLTLLIVITIFGVGYLATVNVLVAQSLAQKRYRHCGMYAWQGIWTAFGCGVIAVAVFTPISPWIFSLFGHEPGVTALEIPYFQISLFALAPEMGAVTLSAFFVAIGQPRHSMVGALIAATTNGFFNYVFIWGHFGCPEFGMSGSAWSTVIASSFHFLYLFIVFVRNQDSRLATRKSRPEVRGLAVLGDLGIPAGLQAAVDYFSFGVLIIAFVGTFGTAHLAAGAILITIAQAAFLPADGIGTQVLAQVANAVGLRKFKLARVRAFHGMRLVLGYLIAFALCLVLLRTPIANAFADDPLVVSITRTGLLILAFILVADAVGVILLHCLQGAGDIVWTAAASIVSAAVIILGGGMVVVFFLPGLGSLGIWIVAAVYSCSLSALYLWRWHRGNWTHIVIR